MTAVRATFIADLRDRIASLEGGGVKRSGCLSFGVTEIDAALPGGGLAHGAIHEFAGGGAGTVDGAAAALFAAGVPARTKGKVVWCLTRPDLFFPALAQAGLQASRVVFVEGDKEEDVLASMEEALSYGGLGAVVGELVRYPWSPADGFISRQKRQAPSVSWSVDGVDNRRQTTSVSRRRPPPDGGSASCRRSLSRFLVSDAPGGFWS